MGKYLDRLTVKEFEEFTKQCKTVILPIGIVEQHGYHLPLRTDIDNVEKLLEKCVERIDAAVAPIVPYCYSGGELKGTINISPQVFSLYVMDICSELVRNGFLNIVVLLGHGGTDNRVALENSLKMFLKKNPGMEDVTLSLIEIFYLSDLWMKEFTTGPEYDFNAGYVETSLMLYWNPQLVKEDIIMDEPYVARMMRTDQDWFEVQQKAVDHKFIIPKLKQRDEIKVGVMGFPEKATREFGEKICNEMIENLIKYIDLINREK